MDERELRSDDGFVAVTVCIVAIIIFFLCCYSRPENGKRVILVKTLAGRLAFRADDVDSVVVRAHSLTWANRHGRSSQVPLRDGDTVTLQMERE